MVTDFIQPVSGSRKVLAAVGCGTNGKLLYPKHVWGSSHLSLTGTRQSHSETMMPIKSQAKRVRASISDTCTVSSGDSWGTRGPGFSPVF